MRTIARGCILISFLGLMSHALAADDDRIRLFIPAFTGPQELGHNVATVLLLQIWKTLRKVDPSTGKHLGHGKVVWDTQPLVPADFDTADATARQAHTQMVLWGTVYPYGDGVVVQTYLSVPRVTNAARREQREQWTIKVGPQIVSMDLPSRAYEFESIVLKRSIVDRYSLPSSLQLCEQPINDCQGSEVGDVITTLKFDPTWAQVVNSAGRKGWVYLPPLADQPSAVPNFVGAVFRLHRGDYTGAAMLLDKVLKVPILRPKSRLAALLLRARANEQRGRSGVADAEAALQIDSYSVAAIRTLVMAELADATRQGGVEAPLAGRVRELLHRSEALFPNGDSWLVSIHNIVDR